MRQGVVVTTVKTTSSGDGKFVFDGLIPDTYEMSTLCIGYTAEGWRGESSEIGSCQFRTRRSLVSTDRSAGKSKGATHSAFLSDAYILLH